MTKLGRLKTRSHDVPATVNIGKDGLTDGVMLQIKGQLQRKKLIKIRINPSVFKDRKTFAQELATQLKATLVRQVGFVIVLAKR